MGITLAAASTDKLDIGLASVATPRMYTWRDFRTNPGAIGFPRYFDSGDEECEIDHGGDTFIYQRSFDTSPGRWTCPAPSMNAWHCYVLAYDASSTTNDPLIWIDGVAQTVTETAAPAGTASNTVAVLPWGNRSAGDRSAAGIHAEIAIYNRMPTTGEAIALSKGLSPRLVPRGRLVYIPGMRAIYDAHKRTVTVTGTTPGQHPRIAQQGVTLIAGATAAAPDPGGLDFGDCDYSFRYARR